MKVERVSYPIATPSAARGLVEAICWEPEIRWIVTEIAILKSGRFQSVTRNEVQRKISTSNVNGWMKDPASFKPFFADARRRDDGENATQRSMLALRDVAYGITVRAQFDTPTPRDDESPEKYAAMLERRVERGQCFHRPYLGMREFAADFGPWDRGAEPPDTSVTMDLGLMLYDIIYAPRGNSGRNEAVFFRATVTEGVMITDPGAVLAGEASRDRLLKC